MPDQETINAAAATVADLDFSAGGGASRRLAAYRAAQGRTNYGRQGQALSAPVAAKAAAPATQPARAAESVGTGFSKAYVDASAKLAVDRERARMTAVFNSPSAKGRERTAAKLLAGSEAWSAASISERLAALPSDAELDRQRGENSQSDAAAVWKQAIAANNPTLNNRKA